MRGLPQTRHAFILAKATLVSDPYFFFLSLKVYLPLFKLILDAITYRLGHGRWAQLLLPIIRRYTSHCHFREGA